MPTPTPPHFVERRAPTTTDDHWSFKKEIQISHIISTMVIAFTVMLYVQGMEKRISIIEDKMLLQRDRDDKQDIRMAETMARINGQIDRMDSKLDRLIERVKP